MDEHGVCLSGEERAEEPVVEVGEETAELRRRGNRPDRRSPGDVAGRVQAAPRSEAVQRPDGDLLQTDDRGRVVHGEPDHLLEERLPSGWLRIAVEEVPGADEQALYCTADACDAC